MPDETRQTVDRLWKWKDVADFLGVSVPTARNRVRDDGLPFRRIGGRIRFIPDEVREWSRQQPAS